MTAHAPEQARTTPTISTERALAISVRTAHLLAVSMYAGGQMMDPPPRSQLLWRRLTTVTGAALLVIEASHSPNWVHQGRGVTTMAHVGVLAGAHLDSRLTKGATIAALLIGSVGSHLPRSVRKWSILTRSVLP